MDNETTDSLVLGWLRSKTDAIYFNFGAILEIFSSVILVAYQILEEYYCISKEK